MSFLWNYLSFSLFRSPKAVMKRVYLLFCDTRILLRNLSLGGKVVCYHKFFSRVSIYFFMWIIYNLHLEMSLEQEDCQTHMLFLLAFLSLTNYFAASIFYFYTQGRYRNFHLICHLLFSFLFISSILYHTFFFSITHVILPSTCFLCRNLNLIK